MNRAPLLRGEKVRLTALAAEDMVVVARWHQDSEFLRLLDARPAMPSTEAALKEWLEEERKGNANLHFGVHLTDGDALIGMIGLESISWGQQVSWISVGIGEAMERGKGYGYEAMSLAIDFAFRELNMRRVQLTVFSYNQRAMALYERLGFQREGAYRESLQRDGQLYDTYIYGLLRREWEGKDLTGS